MLRLLLSCSPKHNDQVIQVLASKMLLSLHARWGIYAYSTLFYTGESESSSGCHLSLPTSQGGRCDGAAEPALSQIHMNSIIIALRAATLQ